MIQVQLEASAFYSRRLLQKYDVGVSYQYMDILEYPAGGPSSPADPDPDHFPVLYHLLEAHTVVIAVWWPSAL